MPSSSDWISISDAPARVGRSLSTIYSWISDGHIRTMRPGRILWLNLPDLLATEAAKTRTRMTTRERRHAPEELDGRPGRGGKSIYSVRSGMSDISSQVADSAQPHTPAAR